MAEDEPLTDNRLLPEPSSRSATLTLLLLVAGYLAILLGLIPVKPLWLDEVLQLTGTVLSDWGKFIQHVVATPGGAPLGYLSQHWLVSAVGLNIWSARLVSVLAGTLGMMLFAVLAGKTGLSPASVIVAVCLWMICPSLLRYSLEARPYMQALALAIAAVLCQQRLESTGDLKWALAVIACLGAAVYSQPFAIFAPVGYALFSLPFKPRKYQSLTCAAMAAAVFLFLPWYFLTRHHWSAAISQTKGGFELKWSLAFILIKECLGDGYAASVPVLVLAGRRAWRTWRSPAAGSQAPIIGAILSGVVLALTSDALFNYFYANRQLLYVLPFVLLIAADEIVYLWSRGGVRRALMIALVSLFAAASVDKDYRYFSDTHEDWSGFTAKIAESLDGGCLLAPDKNDIELYAIFNPHIPASVCDSAALARRVIVARHAYTDPQAGQSAESGLLRAGYTRVATQKLGFGEIDEFELTR
ncbi:MAG TPA: glycosyltransferase family 39 protein [Bryobacteraceae bacterium]|nr:glycosyltransferase family 39 protein [Bryobacteraceae bacterium]